MAVEPGSQFGQYRIIGLLGTGGMARVYHAMQSSPQREVALKVINPELAADPSFRIRFQREANVLARLEHPNILPIYETGTINDQPYICYRLVRGGTMRDLMGTPWTIAAVTAMLTPVASALDFAHSQGIVHRDIKPSNILLTRPNEQGERTPIVADFGLARILDPAASGGAVVPVDDSSVSLTQAGVGLGTPAYMAPEQVLGKQLSGPTDQYALAVTAYQALTGTVPYSATTALEVALMHVNASLPPPSTRNPQLTSAVDAVLMKAMSREPGDRYATAGEFMRALAATEQAWGQSFMERTIVSPSLPRTSTIPTPTGPTEASFTPIPRVPPPQTPLFPSPAYPQQPAPKGRLPLVPILAGAGVVVVAGIIAGAVLLSGGGKKNNNAAPSATRAASAVATPTGAKVVPIVTPAPGTTSTSSPTPSSARPTPSATPSSAGFADGQGAAARFNGPSDAAMDAAGNIYIADSNNNRIRKITQSGMVTTFAGTGKAGLQNGPGNTAQFSAPECIAVDSSGNVYVGDYDNDVIRKITPAGVVSTLAGSGMTGYLDGGPGVAKFGSLNGLVVDSRGEIYVADAANNRIRIVSPTGTVGTAAGTGANGFADGTAAKAEFSSPYGLAIDSKGTLYVADGTNQRIRTITNTGVVSTLAGSGKSGYADGAPGVAQFQSPAAITVGPTGVVWVSDSDNFRIRQIAPDGTVTTLAGTGVEGYADGPNSSAQFGKTEGLVVGFGALYVTDWGNNSIRRVTPDGTVTTLAGPPP